MGHLKVGPYMLQDFRYAIRALVRRPLVTSVAVLSLALGIGVNAAIFSLFDRLILRRLSIPSPDEIVLVNSPGPRPGSRSTGDFSGGVDSIFSYPLFRDLERLKDDGLRLAAYASFGANIAYQGVSSEANGVLVSGEYFPTLGVVPALGRLLGPQDDRVPGAHPVVVLSYDFWRTRFGADAGVLNRTLIVNGGPMTIVGVAPSGFSGITALARTQIFVPLAMAEQAFRDPAWKGLTARNNHWLYLFARTEPGVSRQQAGERINISFAGLIHDVEYPALRTGMGDTDREAFQKRQIYLQDGARGANSNRREIQIVFTLLFAVTGFVLAIACANVANILLAQVTSRSAEMAVRLSLGASTYRVVRLLLSEAALLGILGGAGALLVSHLTISAMLAMLPSDGPVLQAVLDTRLVVFTLMLGLVTSVVFGLFPALHAVRGAVASGVHAHTARVSGSRTAARFRTSMAVTQLALATGLLAVAGLLVVSLVNTARLDLGIKRDGLIAFGVSPSLNGYTPDNAARFFDRLDAALRAMPGVTSVTATTVPLLAQSSWGNNVTVEGFEAGDGTNTHASTARVGADYFHTLGIQIIAGREFTDADTKGLPKVAVVNEAFARKFNLVDRVIGKHMALGAGTNKPLDIEIVGLVRDAKYDEVREPAPPQFVTPYRQVDTASLTFYVRSNANTPAVLRAIPATVRTLDANIPIRNLRTMEEQIQYDTSGYRALTTMSSAFAGLAVVLAAIGLYAVLAYGIAQRMREIGIRVALGATPRNIRSLVLGQVGRIAIVGVGIGAALALGLGRLSQTMLFGVERTAPAIIAGAAALALGVAFAAAVLPARRATLVQPVEVLKAE
jgi:predicted permease